MPDHYEPPPGWRFLHRADLGQEGERLARMVHESQRRTGWEARQAQSRAEGWVPADEALQAAESQEEARRAELYRDLMESAGYYRAEAEANRARYGRKNGDSNE